jgi:hypothetical protein
MVHSAFYWAFCLREGTMVALCKKLKVKIAPVCPVGIECAQLRSLDSAFCIQIQYVVRENRAYSKG